MSRPKAWSPADDAYLRGHYPTQPTAAIAAHLDRAERHVRQRAYELGIKKAQGAKTHRKSRWHELDDLLQLLYTDMSNADLHDLLGLPVPYIAKRANMLGLRKAPSVLTQIYRDAMLRKGPCKGQFTAGNRPWNLGVTGYHIESSPNQFQPGNRPPTWVPVGSERWTTPSSHRPGAQSYLLRKIAEPNVWAPVHHILWQQHHGPIPAGHVVAFHDSDPSNLTISNLRCIPRAELSRSTGADIPIDLLPVWQLTRQLQREITEMEKAQP